MKVLESIRDAIGRPLLGISLLAALVMMAMPTYYLSRLRKVCHPLDGVMRWLEQRGSFMDMDHVALFIVLAFFWGLISPPRRRWLLALALPALAVVTELVQFYVPGRKPRLGDVRDDIVGAILGWGLAMSLLWLGRWISRRRHARKSLEST